MNTPGVGGYVVAWLVSVLGFSAELALSMSDGAPYLLVLALSTAFAMVISLPFAGAGIELVHLACREVPAQALHVAAAGVAGACAGVLLMATGCGWLCVPLLAAPTALGRLVVVPMVWRRRAAAAR